MRCQAREKAGTEKVKRVYHVHCYVGHTMVNIVAGIGEVYCVTKQRLITVTTVSNTDPERVISCSLEASIALNCLLFAA